MLEPVPRIIADIGGTNARFALLSNGNIQDEILLQAADYSGFVIAVQDYLSKIGNPIIKEVAVAIATPIGDDKIKMTNHNWSFSIEQARQDLQLDRLIFRNDFSTLALSIPHLDRSVCHQVGGGERKDHSPIGVLGPGTGLGVSGLIYSDTKWHPIEGEGGHVSLSPVTKRECEILELCLQKDKHISAERLISGMGLQKIYQSLCRLEDQQEKYFSAEEISENGLNNIDKNCVETLEVFCGLLGTVAGNLALTLGAKGGIYIGGGIIPKLGGFFENSSFREQFENKGRFTDYLKKIPVFVIHSPHAALIGISQSFD